MGKFLSKHSLIFASMVEFAVVLGAYLSVASTRLTWSNFGNDGGDFLAALLTHGIAHPTGYPTYLILGELLQRLPFGSPYLRAEMLSFLPAAASAALLCALVSTSLAEGHRTRLLAGLLAGLAWGLSPLVWSQAVIIEVHGLQALFIVLALWWALWLNAHSWQARSWPGVLLAAAYGLGLGNHVTLILFAPALLWLVIRALRQGMPQKILLAQGGAALLGLCVYAYLPLTARGYPAMNWGNPQTFGGFWWMVSGSPYRRLLFHLPPQEIISRFSAWAALLRSQVGLIGLVLAIIGLVQYRPARAGEKWILLWILASTTLFSIGYGTDDSTAYLFPTVMVIAISLGLGVCALEEYHWRSLPAAEVAGGVLLVALLAQLPGARAQVDPRRSTTPADYAEQALARLPKNTILLTSSDPDTFPLWYYHLGLKQRPDLTIVVLPLTQFAWYQDTLVQVYTHTKFPAPLQADTKNTSWGEQVSSLNPGRPICRSNVSAAEGSKIHIEVNCSTGLQFNFE